MRAGKFVAFAIKTTAVLLILMFCSCGEMNSLLPFSKNYQVSAAGEKFTLDEHAMLSVNEKIQPFFISPIRGDPDIAEVAIFLETPDGKQAGGKIRYIADSAYLHETFNDRDDSDNAEENPPDGTDYPDKINVLNNLDSLPFFRIPAYIKAGSYRMVFQVYSKNKVLLSQSEKNIYYMADEKLEISDINAYLPACFVPEHLIPVGTTLLLKAGITATEGLDPYIYWYNGGVCLSEGRVSEGANSMLWKTPQTGFHNIRAEVIPFQPAANETSAENLPGTAKKHRALARELSIPVSANGTLTGQLWELLDNLEEQGRTILHEFYLAGSLKDSRNPQEQSAAINIPARKTTPIIPEDENNEAVPETAVFKQPNWHTVRDVYGLAAGPEDIYQIPFVPAESGDDYGITFIIRFSSISDGGYFNISFNPESPEIRFVRNENLFYIIPVSGEEEKVQADIRSSDGFYILALDLYIQKDFIRLTIGDDAMDPLLAESTQAIVIPYVMAPDSPGLLQIGDEQNAGIINNGEFSMVLGGISVIY